MALHFAILSNEAAKPLSDKVKFRSWFMRVLAVNFKLWPWRIIGKIESSQTNSATMPAGNDVVNGFVPASLSSIKSPRPVAILS